MTTINRTNIAMLSREMRSNDWRINGLERKLDALNAKLNDLLEEGGSGSGGDNTGGGSGSGGDNGSSGKLTFKLNENIRYFASDHLGGEQNHFVYTTTQTFNGTPTEIDGVDAIYLVNSDTSFESSYLDDVTGGDWRFLSSDYTVRVGDTLYTTSTADSIYPPYTLATMESGNGSPRTIFTAYSQGDDPNKSAAIPHCVRTIGTPAAIKGDRFVRADGDPLPPDHAGRFRVTTDFFGTAATEEYANRGILEWHPSLNQYKMTDNMQLLDSVTSDIYVMIMASGVYADAFELSYH